MNLTFKLLNHHPNDIFKYLINISIYLKKKKKKKKILIRISNIGWWESIFIKRQILINVFIYMFIKLRDSTTTQILPRAPTLTKVVEDGCGWRLKSSITTLELNMKTKYLRIIIFIYLLFSYCFSIKKYSISFLAFENVYLRFFFLLLIGIS